MAETDSGDIQPADRGTVMISVADRPEMQDFVWERLEETWDQDPYVDVLYTLRLYKTPAQ